MLDINAVILNKAKLKMKDEKDSSLILNNINKLYDAKFIKMYETIYNDGHKYYIASRRNIDNLSLVKNDEDIKNELPDAVSCIVILYCKNMDMNPRLLTMYEYRHPIGQFLLGVPAGIIDKKDLKTNNAILHTAERELKEETGIDVNKLSKTKESILNREAFSTPGFTDESNALVCMQAEIESSDILTNKNNEDSEHITMYRLIGKEEAIKFIQTGKDDFGNSIPLITYTALLYFISGIYENI